MATKKIKKTNSKKKFKLNKKRLILFITIIFILSFLAVGTGFVMASVSDVPSFNPKSLDTNASTVILDKDGNVFARVHGVENRLPVKIERIPKNVRNSFIAIEDVRFYEHHGVSLRDISRAIYIDLTKKKAEQGASTITQQLAKLTFLTPDKTPKRKIQEMYLAIQIERQYTKDEILEMYLNKIYFAEGAYGIQAAAQTYFGVDVDKLTIAQAATLAAIPKGPAIYDPVTNPKNAKERRDLVISNMEKYGFINHKDAETAKKEELQLNVKSTKELYNHPYFVDYVIDRLKEKGYSDDRIYKGGLTVYTTMDPKIQDATENVLSNKSNFPYSVSSETGLQPQSSAVITDPHTGYIKALVGGRDYIAKRQLNRVVFAQGTKGRPAGSSIKPIIAYGPAIENGASPASIVDDSPLHYSGWDPKNDDKFFRGIITLRTSITYSINIGAIETLQKYGLSNAINFAKKLGITTLDEKSPNLSYALGTVDVKPIEMAGAYGAFDNNGIYVEPTAIIKVEDKNGKVDEIKQEKHVAMKPTTAYIMTSMMQSVVNEGTATAAQLANWQVAGKTGTTDDAKNLWFSGYTPSYVGIVWIGYDNPKPMPNAYAGMYAAPIWRQIMQKAHENLNPVKFEQPEGIVTATVCKKSGDLPGPDCPPEDLVTDIFARGTVPTKVCDAHVVLEVCTEDNNQLANEYCPTKVKKTFLRKPDIPNRNGNSADPELSPPTQTCTMHGPSTKNSTGDKTKTNNGTNPPDNQTSTGTGNNGSGNTNNTPPGNTSTLPKT